MFCLWNIRVLRVKGIVEGFDILALNDVELYASKINARLSRATSRDLYDVNAMINSNIIENSNLLRKCLIFYNMVGGEQNIDDISFENIKKHKFCKIQNSAKTSHG